MDHAPDPTFCDVCAGITVKDLYSENGYTHAANILKLQSSSSHCHLCRLIKLALLQSARGNDLEEVSGLEAALELFSKSAQEKGHSLQKPCPIILALFEDGMFRPLQLHIRTTYKQKDQSGSHTAEFQPTYISLGMLFFHEEPDPVPLVPRVDESALFENFRMRLFDPNYRHPAYRRSGDENDESLLPTRVLDLGDLKVLNSDLRLVEGLGRRGHYCTLSYRWGGFQEFLTEKGSYESRLDCIKFLELPKLFQEAVLVTRRIGVRYLWIDALCIIQGSKEDWEREVVKMADVYRNCQLRIAATAASNPTQSFYPPKPIVTSVRVAHLEDQAGGNDFQGGNETSKKCFITLPKYYARDVDDALLNTRAWVLQERLLAPNTIHFCEDHIYLETPEGVIGEDGIQQSYGWKSSIEKSGVGRARLMQENSLKSNYNNGSDTSDSWLRIAELYSNCKITKAEDKLAAIAGLAKDRRCRGKFPYLHSKYYLGMWESTLHEDLLWIARNTQKLKPLPILNLPSWAWIAYEGPVTFLKDKRSLRDPTTVVTAPVPAFELVKLIGPCETHFLPLPKPVSLVIRSRICKVPAIGPGVSREPKALTHEAISPTSPFRHYPGTRNRPIPLAAINDCFEFHDEHGGLIGFLSIDNSEPLPTAQLWCVHIATLHDETYAGSNPLSRLRYAFEVDQVSAISSTGLGEGYQPSGESYILAYCLILVCSDPMANEYRRVGIAEVKYDWICQAS